VPEYLLSIYDNSKTVTSVETSPPNMVAVCVTSTSITKSQNLLPISAETSLPSLSTLLPPDTFYEEITAARLLKKTRCTFLLSQDQAFRSIARSTVATQRDLQSKKRSDIKPSQNVNVGQRRFKLNDGTKTCIIQDRLHADETPKAYMHLMSTPFWCSKE
jgi:hypothetical protein